MLVRTAETTLSPRSLAFSSVRRQVVPNGRAHFFDTSQMKAIADLALSECKGGPSTAKWRRRIEAIDRSGRFSREALLLFQNLQARLGISTTRPIALPIDDQPFWHRAQRPFANYQSTDELPNFADVVIIGAGLTGAAAAYHLKDAGLSVAVIEKGDPAGEASGRNGGNFELLPENSVGTYEGLAPGAPQIHEKTLPSCPIRAFAGRERATGIVGSRTRTSQSRYSQRNNSQRRNCL